MANQTRALLKALRQYGTASTSVSGCYDFWLIKGANGEPTVLNVAFMDPDAAARGKPWVTLISHPEYIVRKQQRMHEAEIVLRALGIPYRRLSNGQFWLNGYEFDRVTWHGTTN